MKKLDKELYPEFAPDPNEPFREPIAKLGKKITDRIPRKLGLKKITRNNPEYRGLAGVLPEIVWMSGLAWRRHSGFADQKFYRGARPECCDALYSEADGSVAAGRL